MKYRVIAARLNVRSAAGGGASVLEKLPKGAEFVSKREIELTGATWAELTRGGWVCIVDRNTRYCEEIPQPVPAPETPGAPLSIEQRLEALEARVAELERQV